MLHFEPWKQALIALIVLVGAIAVIPNFAYQQVVDAVDARKELKRYQGGSELPPEDLVERAGNWPTWAPSSVINLGLDLQGGAHFLLEAQLDDIYREQLDVLWPRARTALREEREVVGPFRRLKTKDARLLIKITKPEGVARAQEILNDLAQPLSVLDGFGAPAQSDLEIAVFEDDPTGQTFTISLSEAARTQLVDTTMGAVVEVIRTRVDATGTREPTIQRQGENRVLVQLPGAQNVDVEALTRVAKLEFRMVDESVSPSDAAAGRTPSGSSAFPYREGASGVPGITHLALSNTVDLTGDQLADARPGFDGRTNQPVVNLRFDSSGARIFGNITRQSVGQRFAVVLDGEILVAPEIRQYIPDGSAQISGNFSVTETASLSINLRSGNLPVALTVEESSFVGPELGADSIAAGQIACIIGFMAVLVYMWLSYGMFGLFANAALLLNVVLIFGALSILGATLTLPGIAGVVLTIGMAVDANVLIFERIREEMRGKRPVARAIELGYERALSAIIDANVTTFIAAAILFVMGSGPVKGFAVTLGIGIMTSVFTAVMLTRYFVATWYGYARPKTLAL